MQSKQPSSETHLAPSFSLTVQAMNNMDELANTTWIIQLITNMYGHKDWRRLKPKELENLYTTYLTKYVLK